MNIFIMALISFRIVWAPYPEPDAMFEIWRAESAGDPVMIASGIDPTDMEWFDTTVVMQRRYEYRVRATRGDDVSPFSNVVAGISFHIGPPDTISWIYYGAPDSSCLFRISGPRVRWNIELYEYLIFGKSSDAFLIRAVVDRLPPYGIVDLSDLSMADITDMPDIRAIYGKPCRFYPVFRH